MASIIARRSALSVLRKCLRSTSIRTMATGSGIPEYVEHATGIERIEIEKLQEGDTDMFKTQIKVKAKGTKEKPIEIPSFFDKRIVGCICEDDQTFIRWMWLHEGDAQRCECGSVFKLVKMEPVIKGDGGH